MSTELGTVTPLPPRMITTPTRQQRSNAIRSAVDQFAARVDLTPAQRHLLGLVIDEAIEAVTPRPSTLAPGNASNETMLPPA
ncbi:hypothetical protein [Trinickia acidisoli]|uniref:hypothetical protein n=1 Tax=Trinickia acidisoli TaxID=2767482 RepID=UPI001A90C794|nr:hypothetical protein [Trinickia acidisoli]